MRAAESRICRSYHLFGCAPSTDCEARTVILECVSRLLETYRPGQSEGEKTHAKVVRCKATRRVSVMFTITGFASLCQEAVLYGNLPRRGMQNADRFEIRNQKC